MLLLSAQHCRNIPARQTQWHFGDHAATILQCMWQHATRALPQFIEDMYGRTRRDWPSEPGIRLALGGWE